MFTTKGMKNLFKFPIIEHKTFLGFVSLTKKIKFYNKKISFFIFLAKFHKVLFKKYVVLFYKLHYINFSFRSKRL